MTLLFQDYQPQPDLLKDRVILVTGAGQGLGRLAALRYAAHGATVVLHGRNRRKLEKVYDEIVALGAPEPAAIPLDFEKAGDVDFVAMAEAIGTQLGRLDGILHNAALLHALSPLQAQTIEEWMRQYKVNTASVFALTRACLPLLLDSPQASVLVTGETHGLEPHAYWGGFAASTAALPAFVKMAAEEWEASSVRVNLIIPGKVHSPQRIKTHPGELKEERIDPEGLMPAYLYLMGQESHAINGQVLALSA